MKCLCDPLFCTGCGACTAFGSNDEDYLVKGDNGFLHLNEDKEVELNRLCSERGFICPQLKDFRNSAREAYAVQLKDADLLLESTSGGMFSALAEYIFSRSGVVYGAVYDEELHVYHKMATNMKEIEGMHGSKYILSNLGNVFLDIKKLLDEGRWVLFVSIPCQVAGLKAFLNKEYTTLLTVDLICSGVPNQELFDGFLKDYAQKIGAKKICNIRFRDKHDFGLSHTFVCVYIDKHGRQKRIVVKDRNLISYYNAFGAENCFMHNCYSCKYTGLKRVGDFTIGGLWNENIGVPFSYKQGISLVIVNTYKAEQCLRELAESTVNVHKVRLEDAVVGNRALSCPTSSKDESKAVYNDLKVNGYAYVARKYYNPPSVLKQIVRAILPYDLRHRISSVKKKILK